MTRMTRIFALMAAVLLLASGAHAGDESTHDFVNGLYQRFAFRAPTSVELEYWTAEVHARTPQAAETHLKNFFFVHAAYKTITDTTVTADEVNDMVAMLDAGELTYQSVQWSLFQSDEYKAAKARGRVGLPMNPALAAPL